MMMWSKKVIYIVDLKLGFKFKENHQLDQLLEEIILIEKIVMVKYTLQKVNTRDCHQNRPHYSNNFLRKLR